MTPGEFYKFAVRDYAAKAMVNRVSKNLARQVPTSRAAQASTSGLAGAALVPPGTLPFIYPAASGLAALTRGSTSAVGRGIHRGTRPVRKAGLAVKRRLKDLLGIRPEGWVGA